MIMATKPAKASAKSDDSKTKKSEASKESKPQKAATKTKTAKSADVPAKKVNAALAKPLKPSAELAAVVGKDPLPRTEVVSKVWEYIRKHDLQNPENKREILADAKLKAVFGKDKATMFEMNKLFSAHLS
jgi:chromatin remodeling complex protein RSC6